MKRNNKLEELARKATEAAYNLGYHDGYEAALKEMKERLDKLK
jgi:flagellar biosynthesis/type III secretory pathway protein FliH